MHFVQTPVSIPSDLERVPTFLADTWLVPGGRTKPLFNGYRDLVTLSIEKLWRVHLGHIHFVAILTTNRFVESPKDLASYIAGKVEELFTATSGASVHPGVYRSILLLTSLQINILINDKEEPLISDFYLAKVVSLPLTDVPMLSKIDPYRSWKTSQVYLSPPHLGPLNSDGLHRRRLLRTGLT